MSIRTLLPMPPDTPPAPKPAPEPEPHPDGLYCTVGYRGDEINCRLLDVYRDGDGRLWLYVESLEGTPFREWNVQMGDPKYGGGGGWWSVTCKKSVSPKAVVGLWEIGDGKLEYLGLPRVQGGA
jgi:hypothetical protein